MGCFKTWCLSNFPFMEDDIKALDNYHIMCKLYEYIKNIAEDVSNLNSEYNTLIQDFAELKDYVDTYLEDLSDVKQDIQYINNVLDTLASRITDNTNRIEEVNTNLLNKINTDVAILNNKIDNIKIGEINVYDPTTGIISPLQTVINNLYSLGNKDGLTALEFDSLDLTVTAFETYDITVSEFDTQGKIILV